MGDDRFLPDRCVAAWLEDYDWVVADTGRALTSANGAWLHAVGTSAGGPLAPCVRCGAGAIIAPTVAP